MLPPFSPVKEVHPHAISDNPQTQLSLPRLCVAPPQYMLLVQLTRAPTGPQWLPPHPKCNNLLLVCGLRNWDQHEVARTRVALLLVELSGWNRSRQPSPGQQLQQLSIEMAETYQRH